jgi:hypothetical protein
MDLGLYVENIHRQVAVAAEAGGDDARVLAERFVAPLDMALRLTLQDALAAAAEEITTELAPGSVELRLRGRDIEFVVTPPQDESSVGPDEDGGDVTAIGRPPAPSLLPDAGEASMSRINLRLPDHLKVQIEQTALGEGLSVNAWLVRAAAAALDRADLGRRRDRRTPRGARHYTGWVH